MPNAATPPDEQQANARRLGRRVRNDRIIDIWSAAHVAWAFGLAVFVGPWWALALMIAWEPVEIFLLGPLIARWGIAFGHETWRNSLSDMVFDALGVGLFIAVSLVWDPRGVGLR